MSAGGITRRDFSAMTAAGLAAACLPGIAFSGDRHPMFKIRTITAGVTLESLTDTDALRRAAGFLREARAAFEDAGHSVQTVRIATSPVARLLPDTPAQATEALIDLDAAAQEAGAVLALGPVLEDDRDDPALAGWVAELSARTEITSLSLPAVQRGRIAWQAVRTAGRIMAALAHASPDGQANFRFAASALVPAGTPFFPAAWHDGPDAFALGLEAAPLVADAVAGLSDPGAATAAIRARFDAVLTPLAKQASGLAERNGWRFTGIDASPAPGPDAGIAAAIEALSGRPFGAAGTLAACAAITDALKTLDAPTCGYSGLMLPVLEDKLLARRAAEGRFGVQDLLLYSSVCGTGLDVVPLPGDTPADMLAALVGDVAALALKYNKPLSARLFPVPGKAAGDAVDFPDNPFLTASRIMPAG